MQVLIIEGSTRSPASTMAHVQALAAAQPAETNCEIVALRELDLPLFEDHRTGGSWRRGEALEGLYRQMRAADVILLATPLYWYSVSHLMKNFLDHWTYFLRHPEAPMVESLADTSFGFVVVGSSFENRERREPVFQSLRLSVDYIKARCIGGFYGVGIRDGQPHPDSLAAISQISLRAWHEAGEAGPTDRAETPKGKQKPIR